MRTAAEYRAEALRCQELANHFTSQKRELSSVLMELAQEYNRAARQAEERDVSLQARARQKAAGELVLFAGQPIPRICRRMRTLGRTGHVRGPAAHS